MAKGNEIMGSHQEVRQTARAMAIIRDGYACNWIPAPSSAPAQVDTTDGMMNGKAVYCKILMCNIQSIK
eukprot:10610296-Ditylum_brightwellii.AAC.1